MAQLLIYPLWTNSVFLHAHLSVTGRRLSHSHFHSAKWCNWADMVSPKWSGLKHLFTQKFDSCSMSFCHMNHCCACFSGIFWSQPHLSLHSCLRRSFAGRTQGATRPRGSYMEFTTERIPLLVVGLSRTFMANLNVSVSMHHRIPRALSTGRLLLLKSNSFDWNVMAIYVFLFSAISTGTGTKDLTHKTKNLQCNSLLFVCQDTTKFKSQT